MTETAYNIRGFWDIETDATNVVKGNASFNLGTSTIVDGLLKVMVSTDV